MDQTKVKLKQFFETNEFRKRYSIRTFSNTKSNSEFVHNVPFDAATFYAEKNGKRLPSEFEYDFAASNSNKTHFPWGNDRGYLETVNKTTVDSKKAGDKTQTIPPIWGLYSGGQEWTSSPHFAIELHTNKVHQREPPSHLVVKGFGPSFYSLGREDFVEQLLIRGVHQRSASPPYSIPENISFAASGASNQDFLTISQKGLSSH